MNFLNPLLLLGILAAALPIIIHLINRRRAVRRPFPALDFLLRSQKKLARRLKLRQLLLLLLRVAALLLLALAMARPYLISDAGTTEADRMPVGVVFVVDDSASMGYGGGATWDKAVDAVEERLSGLRAWDRVGLVFAGAWPGGEPLGESPALLQLSDDPGDVREALSGHGPSERATDLVAGLRTAAEVLAGADMPRKRIILVTDGQKTGFDPQALPTGGLGAAIEILDVGQEGDRPNLAIVEAEALQQSTGARPEFELSATVQNFGAQDALGVEVRLSIDGAPIGAGLVDVPAGKTARKSFTHQFEGKGLHRARLELAEGVDTLPVDNVRHLPIQLVQKIKVLLVNGDPRSVPYLDELYYLERALQPSKRSTSAVQAESTAVEGLAGRSFGDYDVVVMANVEKIPRASVAELTRFVKGGGGLLFVAGDMVKPELYNSLFAELLPKPVRSIKRLADRDDPDAPVKIARFGQIDRSHPVFKVFDLPGGETVHSVPVFSHLLLEPTVGDEARVLMSYGDGAPALIERSVGEGRVALLTTTIDRDWTDFPIRTAFLPLTRRLVQHLARRSNSGQSDSHAVGARVRLEVQPQDKGRVEVRDPEGGRIVLTPESSEDGAPLSFVAREAGHYKVVVTSELPGEEPREIEELAFAVNVAKDEADLTPLPTSELLALLQGAGGEGAEGQADAATLDTPERRVGVWSILLFLVTMVLLGETILGTRRSVLVRLWNLARGRSAEPEI